MCRLQDGQFLNLEEMTFKNQQTLLSFCLQNHIPWILPSRALKRPKSLKKSTAVILHFALFFSLWILTPLDCGHCSQGCSQTIYSEHFFFVSEYPIQWSISSLHLYHLCQEGVMNTRQKPPVLLLSCCVVLPAYILGRFKSSIRTGTDNCETSSNCIKKVSFTSSQSGSLQQTPTTILNILHIDFIDQILYISGSINDKSLQKDGSDLILLKLGNILHHIRSCSNVINNTLLIVQMLTLHFFLRK